MNFPLATAPAVLSSQMEIPSLALQDGFDIEWWFLQGWLEGAGTGRKHVMAALFRMHEPGQSGPAGAMLIQHVLDTDSGEAWIDSRVTQGAMQAHEAIAQRVAMAAFARPLQPLALWRHRRDINGWMRSSGVVIDKTGPRFSNEPLSIARNGFAFEQDHERFSLHVTAGPEFEANLTLTPASGWLVEDCDRLEPSLDADFAYLCCPRLTAAGQARGLQVTGRFWLDRQWGPYDGWLLAPQGDGYRVLGWDWFGINLDDGRDLLVCRHRDAASGKILSQWGVVFDDGLPRKAGPVRLLPCRFWTSPSTGARYPLAWRLVLPELDFAALVEPLLDDQEIPVYGTTAIWEGAVGLSGTAAGRTVSGSGRMELVGYASPLTVGEHVRRNVARFARKSPRQSGGATGSDRDNLILLQSTRWTFAGSQEFLDCGPNKIIQPNL